MQTQSEQEIRFGLVMTEGMTVGIDIGAVSEVYPVRTVSELMVDAPGLLGAMELRGEPVPLYDPRPLCGVAGKKGAPGIAVISAEGGRRLALGFDAIGGLIKVPASRIKRFSSASAGAAAPAFHGAFQKDGRTISIIDPRTILARTDLPTVPVTSAREGEAPTDGANPFLTFECGGARFGVEAVAVDSTVPRQTIEVNSLTGGACLGSITHHGRRVPVMHANDVLGIGTSGNLRTAEVVVLRFPDGRSLGFAVEAIRRIQLVAPMRMTPVPGLLKSRSPSVSAVFRENEDRQTFLIDVEALTADDALRSMAALSEVTAPAAQPSVETAIEADCEVVTEQRRYLVVRAGSALAIPIGQLARIIEPPQELTPLAGGACGVRGIFNVDGAPVPLIDLAICLGGRAFAAGGRPRVLLAGPRDERIGFLVENVDNIESSAWRRDEAGVPDDPSLVCLVGAAGRRVLPKVDLEAMAVRLSAEGSR